MVDTGSRRNLRSPAAALALALIAFAALVLGLLASGAPTHAAASSQADGSRTYSPGSPVWHEVASVVTNTLRDVQLVSQSDGWAVGELGVVLRYNGISWSPVPTFTNEPLVDVHMLSASEGYILGWGNDQMGGNIYRWNGTQWSLFHTTATDVNRIDDVGSELWVAGLFKIYHYDGAQWVEEFEDQRNIFSIQMYDTGQGPGGWAVGANQFMAQYSNGSWALLDPSPAPQTLYYNSFTSPTDGWSIGFTATTYILHWNGVQWSWDYTISNNIFLDRIHMLAPTLGWASGPFGDIVRFDGTQWVHEYTASRGLRNISMLSPSAGWAVGDNGVMVKYGEPPPSPTPTNTPLATATSTACAVSFSDVPPTDPFYANIRCLACRGILGGYSDGTFRPYNNITRGQISKVVSNAAGFSEPVSGQTFTDVPPSNPFYEWIERLTARGIMSGYPCGSVGEPCDPQNRPYFRWGANATRGQLSKIVSNAAGFSEPVSGQTFTDVPPSNPFYAEIERLASRGIMGGYPCGGVGEPCDPQNRPYFRWAANVTRGQASKIVANTFFAGCITPQRAR